MTFAKTFAVAAGGLLIATATLAQAPMRSPANPDPSAAHPGTYSVEAGHTRVLFSLSHMGFSTWYGDFTDASGTLKLNPSNPSTSLVDVTVPVGSLSTTSTKLDGELKAADVLDVGKFPTATFRSRETRVTGPGRADVMGDLTLHGVTRPLTLHVRFNGAGSNPMNHVYTAGFEARGEFMRSAFGVTKYLPLIGDEVELIISGAFVQGAT